jgi:hypothetical protein
MSCASDPTSCLPYVSVAIGLCMGPVDALGCSKANMLGIDGRPSGVHNPQHLSPHNPQHSSAQNLQHWSPQNLQHSSAQTMQHAFESTETCHSWKQDSQLHVFSVSRSSMHCCNAKAIKVISSQQQRPVTRFWALWAAAARSIPSLLQLLCVNGPHACMYNFPCIVMITTQLRVNATTTDSTLPGHGAWIQHWL